MGRPTPHPPALLLLAGFSRYPKALEWAAEQAVAAWGPVALASPRFAFSETDYYEATMGPGLEKAFWAFERPFDPGRLVEVKLQTNTWEEAYAKLGSHPELRPLNLDPGYVTLAKLVLASTKDHAHRIYLGRGIYAEITLYYREQRWQPHEWTFADYRRPDYHDFFTECRHLLRRPGRQGSLA
jgi:hypothetical protein